MPARPPARRSSASLRPISGSSQSSVPSTWTPEFETVTPTSQPAATSASRRRAAYGAPDAPVMPRKIRKGAAPLGLRALGVGEELGELVELLIREIRERLHLGSR